MADTFVRISELNTGGGGGGGAVDSVFGRTGNVTAFAGDYNTAQVTENTNLYHTEARVRSSVLTGFSSTTGTVTATDSVLSALEKIDGNVVALDASIAQPNGIAPLDGAALIPTIHLPPVLLGAVVYQGVWDANANTPTITSSVGTQGHYYVVNVAGSTNIDGISTWNLGDWIIFNGSVWQRLANGSDVVSVNGQTGVVILTTTNVAEGTNLYHTDARVRGTVLTGFVAGSGTVLATDTVLEAIQKLAGMAGISTLQDTYNNSTDGRIVTDATRESVKLRRGTAADTDAVLSIQNGAGTTTTTIAGNGVITVPTAAANLTRVSINKGIVNIPYAASFTTDCSLGNVFEMTLTGNSIMNLPINAAAGATYTWIFHQDSVGGRQMTWPSAFKWQALFAPDLSYALVNRTDVVQGIYNGTNFYVAMLRNFG
jgi:hypothetical protein